MSRIAFGTLSNSTVSYMCMCRMLCSRAVDAVGLMAYTSCALI